MTDAEAAADRTVTEDSERRSALWLGAVIGVAIGWSVLFATLAATNHANYGTWAYDLGIYDQAVWKLAHGETFVTVRGLTFWGHHLNLVALALVPAYWLGAGPTVLVVVQALALGAGAVPVFLIARRRLGGPQVAAAFAAVYLLYAPVQFLAWRDFHPETLVITPLLWAWYLALVGRWRWFWVAVGAALATREDAALAVAILGVVFWWRGRHPGRDVDAAGGDGGASWRRHGVRVAVVGIGWYLLATQVVIPLGNGGEPVFYLESFYSRWGGTLPRLVGNVVRHPNWLVSDAIQPDRLRFYRDLLAPLGGLALLSPLTLLMAVPQLVASVIADQPYPRSILYQYTAVMIAPLVISSIEGARRLAGWLGRLGGESFGGRRGAAAMALGAVACAYVTNVAWSPSPIGERYDIAWAHDNARRPALDAAVAAVPDDAVTSSTYNLTPHLAHREGAFDWPNPWVPVYYANAVPWSADCDALVDAAYVDYLVLDRQLLGPEATELVAAMVGPGGDFTVVSDVDAVLVARRHAPGPRGEPLPGNCSTSFTPVLDRYPSE